MVSLDSQIAIAAPASHVWPILADVERWPQWAESFTSVEALDDAPIGPGARFRIKQPKFPSGVWTIAEWHPGRSFAWSTRSIGMAALADHRLVDDGDGCVFRQRLDFEGAIGTLFARLRRGLIDDYLRIEAAGLKSASEGPYRHG